MYGTFSHTPEHMLGAHMTAMGQRAEASREAYVGDMVLFPDNVERYVKVYKGSTPAKPDPKAP